MSNPAFIVDGFTEMRIVQEICPGRPVSRTDLNGKDVTIEAIAKRIAFLVRRRNNRYFPIIALVDRENRSESFLDVCRMLGEAIEKEGIRKEEVRIGVADRMIENWFLAGQHQITDGFNGMTKLKQSMRKYRKITDGLRLFLECPPERIYERSPSFRHFVDLMDGIDCEYLKPLRRAKNRSS